MERENKGNSITWLRVAGAVTALVLILFGGAGNLVRTIKYGLKKLG